MSAYSALILAETGLAHYWRLDEASGTSAADSAPGSSITAGYSNTPTLGAAGLLTGDTDTCISCNGVNQFVDMHNASAVRAGVLAYTWEAWVYPTNASGSFLRILGADDNGGNGPTLLYDGPSNTFRHWRTTSANQISWHGAGINTPYHVAVTYDGTTIRCYLNGQGRGGIIDTASIVTYATDFNIGSTGAYGSFWAGKLDEVALYTVALTGAQIKKHYRQGLNSLLTANNAHWYGAYVNTGQSWDASPPANYGELDTWSNWATNTGATTHKPGVFHCFQNWAGNAHFPKELAKQANQRGADLLVTWEAWDPGAAGTGGHKADQPAYALQNIINGNFDTYLTTWANDIKAYGYPVFLRLFHEFNAADYYPWGVLLDANNNSQSDYIVGGVLCVNTDARVAQAFQHVRTIFNNAGVTNAKFVWCPNVFQDNYSYHPFTSASYPGDAYVDYVGLDGYNTTTNSGAGPWLKFFDLYSQAYDTVAAITSKPIIIPEVACTEDSAAIYTKSAWITQALGTDLPQAFPAVVGFLWEDDVNYPSNPSTIPIDSGAGALSAFQGQIASSQYAAGTPLSFAAPSLTSISPTSQAQGSAFTLTCTGVDFTYDSLVYWGGTALATTFVNSTSLTAAVTSTQTGTAGPYAVTVQTPSMATTAAQTDTIVATDTLTGVSPTTKNTGTAFTLTCTGVNFTGGSVVYWGATALATTFVGPTSVTAAVTTAQTASAGTFTITVQTPGETNAGSATVTLTSALTVFIFTRLGEAVHITQYGA